MQIAKLSILERCLVVVIRLRQSASKFGDGANIVDCNIAVHEI